jgi:hypothetical protein
MMNWLRELLSSEPVKARMVPGECRWQLNWESVTFPVSQTLHHFPVMQILLNPDLIFFRIDADIEFGY